MKEKSSTEMGRAQSDSTSLTLACRNGLRDGHGQRDREVDSGREKPVMQEYDE